MGFVERTDSKLFIQRTEAMILKGAGHYYTIERTP
jgi:hypothetical protein